MNSIAPKNAGAGIPRFPAAAERLLCRLPLAPLAFASQRLVESLARRHPSLFARLDGQERKVFLLDPTDVPVVFRLLPLPQAPRLAVLRRESLPAWDARIAGPLAALIGLVHGAFDGDALFFSRDIVIEGDTEAIVALRNAIDDAEIDFAAEITALFGPLERLVEIPLRRLISVAERLSGVALTRVGGRLAR